MANDLNSVEIVKALEIAVRSLADGTTAMDDAIAQVLAERDIDTERI